MTRRVSIGLLAVLVALAPLAAAAQATGPALAPAPDAAPATKEPEEDVTGDETDDGEWDDVADEGGSGEEGGDDDFSIPELMDDYLTWGGYYENQLMIFTLPRNASNPGGTGWGLTDQNRLRLSLAVRPVPGFGVDADVVFQSFHGTTGYDLRDMLPARLEPLVDALAAVDPSYAEYALENEIYVDNVYLTARFWKIRLTVGKQQMRFGSGYLWNPTDPYNVKDLLDPTYELTGVTAIGMELFLPHEVYLEAYMVPHDGFTDFHLEDTAASVRLRAAFGQWVVAASYSWFRDAIGLDEATFEPVEARRHLVGLEFVGEIGGVGIWGEAAFNLLEQRDRDGFTPLGRPDCPGGVDGICWFEALGGINYTFRGGIVVQAEYLYNGRGRIESERYGLWDWFGWLEQNLRYMGAHYVTATVIVPVQVAHLELALNGIVNAGDHSFVINPWIRWDWNQYLALQLYGAVSWGDDDGKGADEPMDELVAMGHGVFLRLRLSF